jgi:hypothetical protein
MTYLVRYEDSTGRYVARSPSEPLVVGEGNSLYSAIDDLELKLKELQLQRSRIHNSESTGESVLVVQVS